MNGFVVKYCSACGKSFECGSARADFDCWCLAFPLVFEPTDTVDCWCPSCLEKACEEKKAKFDAKIFFLLAQRLATKKLFLTSFFLDKKNITTIRP